MDTQTGRFMDLFRGYSKAYGLHIRDGERYKMHTILNTPSEEVVQDHFLGRVGLGIVPLMDDCRCAFGVLDVDIHTDTYEAAKRCAGLPLIAARSKSGNLHLYHFVKEPITGTEMSMRMHQFAVKLGYGRGTDIYPKDVARWHQNDPGKWILLPYFGATMTDRYAVYGDKKLDLDGFLNQAESLRDLVTA